MLIYSEQHAEAEKMKEERQQHHGVSPTSYIITRNRQLKNYIFLYFVLLLCFFPICFLFLSYSPLFPTSVPFPASVWATVPEINGWMVYVMSIEVSNLFIRSFLWLLGISNHTELFLF